MHKFLIGLWSLVVLTALSFLWISFPSWPDQIAMIELDGRLGSRSSKQTFFHCNFWLIVVGNLLLLLGAPSFCSESYVLKSMPHGDYWLKNEQQWPSGEAQRRMISVAFLFMSLVNGWYFLGLQHQLAANRAPVLVPITGIGMILVSLLATGLLLIGYFRLMKP